MAYEEDAGEALELAEKLSAFSILSSSSIRIIRESRTYIIHATDEQSACAPVLAAARPLRGNCARFISRISHAVATFLFRLGMWRIRSTSNVAAQAASRVRPKAHQANRIINARDGFPELLVFAKRPARQGPSRHHDEHHVVGATDKS